MEPSINIPLAEFARRREGLRDRLRRDNLSGAVIFDSFYVLYFSGFAAIPTERPIIFVMNVAGEPGLFVPRLESEHARAKTGFERVDHYPEYPSHDHPMSIFSQTLKEMGITGAVAADQDGYPWILGYRGPSLSDSAHVKVALIRDWIEDTMAIKSESEVALIEESCKWGNLAHRLLQQYTRPGLTETEVTMRASNEATLAMMSALGSLYSAQSSTSRGASAGYRGQIGRNAAIPHALANNITFRDGDVLVTGAGAGMWGYNSELERTMIIGAPSQEQRILFDHMKNLQEVAFEAMSPGKTCSSVDESVRGYYEKHDLMKYWKHHTGHAIGLRYHEGPFLDTGDHTVLRPGMVFTVEPGLYASEIGGFRHSDTILITETGNRRLTYYPRDLESLTIPA